MYLCEDCRTAKKQPDTGIQRVCECEDCGATTTCIDVPSGQSQVAAVPATTTNSTAELNAKLAHSAQVIATLAKETSCDICGGDPKTVEGVCACNGTGKLTGVLATVREAIVKVSVSCEAAHAAIEKVRRKTTHPQEMQAAIEQANAALMASASLWQAFTKK